MCRAGFASLFVFDFSHKKFDSTGEGQKIALCNFIPLFPVNMSVNSLEILHNDTKYPRFVKKNYGQEERADYQNLTPLYC